jgi:hypothetical protein
MARGWRRASPLEQDAVTHSRAAFLQRLELIDRWDAKRA